MKKTVYAAVMLTLVIGLICCNQNGAPAAAGNQPVSKDSLVSRGRYLVTVMGCSDCHSPKIMGPMGPQADTSRLLSGYPASLPLPAIDSSALKNWVLFNGMQTATVGPWGVSFAANLTSDSSGIGNWTEAQFVKALRQGKAKGLDNNRMLLPPMPWRNLGQLHDEDIKAIFAYLQSTKPINNVVPAALPPGQYGKKS